MSLQNKIDFAVIFTVNNANPNGDPMNDNRPRVGYDGKGEMSDVSLKRKIRDRLLEDGESILMQSNDNRVDDCLSVKSRILSEEYGLGKNALGKKVDSTEFKHTACKKWMDVRSFGEVVALKGDDGGVSISIRGPVSIQNAVSVAVIDITENQITKSVNSDDKDDGKKSSDTMGMKYGVKQATYVTYGGISAQLSEKTGFDENDADKIKDVLVKLFENDASSARPAGSMIVEKVIWWTHANKGGQYSSGRVHRTLTVNNDGTYTLENLDGLVPQELNGF